MRRGALVVSKHIIVIIVNRGGIVYGTPLANVEKKWKERIIVVVRGQNIISRQSLNVQQQSR